MLYNKAYPILCKTSVSFSPFSFSDREYKHIDENESPNWGLLKDNFSSDHTHFINFQYINENMPEGSIFTFGLRRWQDKKHGNNSKLTMALSSTKNNTGQQNINNQRKQLL